MKHSRKYIEEKTAKAGENDLIIFAGDFNSNGPTNIKEAKSYTEHLKSFVRCCQNLTLIIG